MHCCLNAALTRDLGQVSRHISPAWSPRNVLLHIQGSIRHLDYSLAAALVVADTAANAIRLQLAHPRQ